MPRTERGATTLQTTAVKGGTQHTLEIPSGRNHVPALWLVPSGTAPGPAVILLHGLSSEKERMAASVGRALLARGVASLALDLPLHGTRRSTAGGESFKNPLALVGAWRSALREVGHATDWLVEQPETDTGRVGVVGYSLGGFLALMAAAEEDRLQVVALAAAGDLPDATPYAAIVRGLVDPLRAVRRLNGRPLLLVNGRHDTTTRPAQAERLFAAASQPKSMLWYDGGHWPSPATIDQTADWTATALRGAP